MPTDPQALLDDLARRRAARQAQQFADLDKAVGRHIRVRPAPPPPAGDPDDSRIVPTPRVPHDDLEHLARSAWDTAFHGMPWPRDWRVRWARLRPADSAVALCIHRTRLILVDERELGPGGRYTTHDRDALVRTLLHEAVHILYDEPEQHSARFQQTLDLALLHVFGGDETRLSGIGNHGHVAATSR